MVHGLGEQQLAVARLVADELTNPQIASELGISANNVEWLIKSAYQKLGLHGKRELASWWRAQQNAADPIRDAFTKGQREIVEMRAAGKSKSEIARALFITTDNVNQHLKRAMLAVGVNTEVQLGVWLAEQRIAT